MTTTVAGAASARESNVHELRTLVLSRHPAIVIETADEARADAELDAVAGALGLAVFEWTVTRGLVRRPGSGAVYGTADPGQMLANAGLLSVQALFVLKDFGPHLASPAISRAFRELLERFAAPQRLSTIVLLGASVTLPEEIEPRVVRLRLRLPDVAEYRQVIAEVVQSLRATARAAVEIDPGDYDAFAGALSGLTLDQARQAVARVAIEDGRLARGDVDGIVALKARALSDGGLLEYHPPRQACAALGGFAGLRRWLARAQVALGPEAAALGVPAPKGVLLVGVQGCGKSLAARVIADDWHQPLLRLDVGRLYDKYIGESERNLRRALAMAESLAPAVLWIDELEKALATGASGDADGGVGQRLLGAFLTWLQEKRADVFVVATANDLSRLPPELLRKGRFDEIFFVDLPDADERAEILAIHLRARRQAPAAFDVQRIAAAADSFSGAELEQVVISSVLRALQEHRALDADLLLAEVAATIPLARSRREDVERLRALARERFTSVR
jgi:hypothetical protein